MNIEEINEVFDSINTEMGRKRNRKQICRKKRKKAEDSDARKEYLKEEFDIVYRSIEELPQEEQNRIGEAVFRYNFSSFPNPFSLAVMCLPSHLHVYFHALARLYDLKSFTYGGQR